jgi:hypothetical protein
MEKERDGDCKKSNIKNGIIFSIIGYFYFIKYSDVWQ